MRQDLKPIVIDDLSGGINQREALARPNEFRWLENVWFRDGLLQQRPGFKGFIRAQHYDVSTSTAPSDTAVIAETNPSGTFTNVTGTGFTYTGNYKVAGARTYFGWTRPFNSVNLPVATANTNDVTIIVEYYNGSIWKALPNACLRYPALNFGLGYEGKYLQKSPAPFDLPASLSFVIPLDWQKTSVNSSAQLYFVRVTHLGSLSTGTEIDNLIGGSIDPLSSLVDGGASASQDVTPIWATSYDTQYYKNAIASIYSLNYGLGNNAYYFLQIATHKILFDTNSEQPVDLPEFMRLLREQIVIYSGATVQLNGDMLFALNGTPFEFRPGQPKNSAAGGGYLKYFGFAEIETASSLVGTMPDGSNAPYNPALVPQLTAVPNAKFWKFFAGRYFCGGIKEQPQALRWSAEFPAHRVWPGVSYANVIGDDTSEITGLGTVGENLVVFKHSSIWNVADMGVTSDATALHVYNPIKIVSGTGCVAHNSIQEMGGKEFFLSHDGVYTYNGQSATCISDRIMPLIRSINVGRREAAVSAHMHTEDMYMLAVPTNGSLYNNTILVYRLSDNQGTEEATSEGSWYVWTLPTGVFVVSMWTGDGPDQQEELYFMDQGGNIYRMLVGGTDNGATIVPKIELHDQLRNRMRTGVDAREIILSASGNLSAVTANIIADGQATSPTACSLNLTDANDKAPNGFVFSSDKLGQDDIRERRVNFRVICKRLRVQLTHAVKNQMLKLQAIVIGYLDVGRR